MSGASPLYPLMLQLAGRLAVVIGGGRVGRRKVEQLLAAGARVRLVDPCLPERWPEDAEIELVPRRFSPEDLEEACLVFAATDDPDVNACVVAEARRRQCWVNRADLPAAGDFVVPATVRRGALTLAVATEGTAPGLAAALRDRLAESWGEEWGVVTAVAAALRARLLTLPNRNDYNSQVLRFVLDGSFLERVQARDWAGMDRMLADSFGAETSLATLGLAPLTGHHDG